MHHGLHGFALDQPSINGIGPIHRWEKSWKRSETVGNRRKHDQAKTCPARICSKINILAQRIFEGPVIIHSKQQYINGGAESFYHSHQEGLCGWFLAVFEYLMVSTFLYTIWSVYVGVTSAKSHLHLPSELCCRGGNSVIVNVVSWAKIDSPLFSFSIVLTGPSHILRKGFLWSFPVFF